MFMIPSTTLSDYFVSTSAPVVLVANATLHRNGGWPARHVRDEEDCPDPGQAVRSDC
jgi:hypothetical protein